MERKLEKEVNTLKQEEINEIYDRVRGIFKGEVRIRNIEDMDRAMTEYYKSFRN